MHFVPYRFASLLIETQSCDFLNNFKHDKIKESPGKNRAHCSCQTKNIPWVKFFVAIEQVITHIFSWLLADFLLYPILSLMIQGKSKIMDPKCKFSRMYDVCGPCLISLPKWALQIGLSSLKGLALTPRLLQHLGGQLLVPVLHLTNTSQRSDCSSLAFCPLLQHLSSQLLVPVLHLTNISQRSDCSSLAFCPLLQHLSSQLLVPVLHLTNVSQRSDCSLMVFRHLLQHLSGQLLVPILHLKNKSQRSDAPYWSFILWFSISVVSSLYLSST